MACQSLGAAAVRWHGLNAGAAPWLDMATPASHGMGRKNVTDGCANEQSRVLRFEACHMNRQHHTARSLVSADPAERWLESACNAAHKRSSNESHFSKSLVANTVSPNFSESRISTPGNDTATALHRALHRPAGSRQKVRLPTCCCL